MKCLCGAVSAFDHLTGRFLSSDLSKQLTGPVIMNLFHINSFSSQQRIMCKNIASFATASLEEFGIMDHPHMVILSWWWEWICMETNFKIERGTRAHLELDHASTRAHPGWLSSSLLRYQSSQIKWPLGAWRLFHNGLWAHNPNLVKIGVALE